MVKGMANKEKIDYLLLDIRELETLVAGMRDAEVYPVSFFGQTFDLTHKILKDLHALETAQIEMLRKQMEEHHSVYSPIGRHLGTDGTGRNKASHPRTGNRTGRNGRNRKKGPLGGKARRRTGDCSTSPHNDSRRGNQTGTSHREGLPGPTGVKSY